MKSSRILRACKNKYIAIETLDSIHKGILSDWDSQYIYLKCPEHEMNAFNTEYVIIPRDRIDFMMQYSPSESANDEERFHIWLKEYSKAEKHKDRDVEVG